MTRQVDLHIVTQAWQYCMSDTFCYHRHLIMDTNLRRINVQQKLYKAGKELKLVTHYNTVVLKQEATGGSDT